MSHHECEDCGNIFEDIIDFNQAIYRDCPLCFFKSRLDKLEGGASQSTGLIPVEEVQRVVSDSYAYEDDLRKEGRHSDLLILVLAGIRGAVYGLLDKYKGDAGGK